VTALRRPPQTTMTTRKRRGSTLPELLIVLALLSILFAISASRLSAALAQSSMRTACHHIATLFTQAQGNALFQRRDTGVKWVSLAGDVTFTLYEDGNGNGILSSEIRSGVDRRIAGPYSMKSKYPSVSFSFVPGFSGPDPGGASIGNLSDPVRFGRGDICTFSAVGRASPGSVYLSNGGDRQSVVRVTPSSQRVQILDWMPGARKWVRRW